MHVIDWESVRKPPYRLLQDGDRVRCDARNEDGGIGFLTTTIRITLAEGLSWWKGIEVITFDNARINFVETQDQQGTHSIVLDGSDHERLKNGGRLILWKAKAFGIHTPMYILPELHRFLNHELAFTWLDD